MGFDFKIVYQLGKLNIVADILSRSRYNAIESEEAGKKRAHNNYTIMIYKMHY